MAITVEIEHKTWSKSGTRTPGPGTSELRDQGPGTPLKV